MEKKLGSHGNLPTPHQDGMETRKLLEKLVTRPDTAPKLPSKAYVECKTYENYHHM
jgi:hypothetical protein